ncbi:MAG: hypothetical protein JO153_01185 [Solirubrobacterales bacterium]|nr:hypothetical protein [Solirubrobacterales bacterium]
MRRRVHANAEAMMSAGGQGKTEDELGPIDFLAVAFPEGRIGSDGFAALLDLADRGVIQILDLEFVAKNSDGGVTSVAPGDLSTSAQTDLTAWEGASSGLLDASDFSQLAEALQPGEVGAVVVFENRWVLGLIEAWRREGGRLIADGGLAASEVIAALDATETG